MSLSPKLTTVTACRIARLDRNRFNEHVAAGNFSCAPATSAGRARLFDPDDMIALWLFRELMEDGFNPQRAGIIACEVAQSARENPAARAISYVQDYFPVRGFAYPADSVPDVAKWDEVLFPAGSDIRKVTTFRIGKLRDMIAHYTEEERAVIGDENEPADAGAVKELKWRYANGLITSHEFAEEMMKLLGSDDE